MAVIQASSNDATNMVLINGLDYPKGVYITYFGSFEENAGSPVVSTVKVGIKNKFTQEILISPKLATKYNNGTTDYASLDAFMAAVPALLV